MKKYILIATVSVIVSSICGFFLGRSAHTEYRGEDSESSVRISGYKYINPLIECENNGSFAKQKYIPFEQEIITAIKENTRKNHSGSLVSVYFRNLNNGPWFGIGEEEKFLPASLMKVTILISYMKWWDIYPELLDQKISMKEEVGLEQAIVPEKKIEVNTEYSIRDLLYYLIVYSDNNASRLLYSYLPPEIHKKTFLDLGVSLPDITNPNYNVSVKEYASFFRVLYNASYLSRESSEEALTILSQSSFKNGLNAGIPSDITVAHKFGEREIEMEDGSIINQLHDCGIVYHPSYPYLVCIMTRGEAPLETLAGAVGETSKIIFDNIDKRYPR